MVNKTPQYENFYHDLRSVKKKKREEEHVSVADFSLAISASLIRS